MREIERIFIEARETYRRKRIPPVLRAGERAELDSRRWTPRCCYGCGQTACRCPGAPLR